MLDNIEINSYRYTDDNDYLDYDDFEIAQKSKNSRLKPHSPGNPRIRQDQKRAIEGYKVIASKNHERLATFIDYNPSFLNSQLDGGLNTFLHIAVLQDNSELVEFFLKKGSQLHLRNKHGLTPYACCKSDKVKNVFIAFARYNAFSEIAYKDSGIMTPEEERLIWVEKWRESSSRALRKRRRLSSYYKNKAEIKRIQTGEHWAWI